ncbi:MAG: IS30 family transposase [Sporomusa sp.]
MQSYHHFTQQERQSLLLLRKEGKSIRAIAAEMQRSPSSISRELKRNSNKNGSYNAWRATVLYILRRRKCKRRFRFESDQQLRDWTTEHIKLFWPPETITALWKIKHPGARLSHCTVYRALRRNMLPDCSPKTHLRRRNKRKYSQRSNYNSVQPEHTIHERCDSINNRERIGDWEGDTVYGGINKGYLTTCVDRLSRFLAASCADDKSTINVNQAMVTSLQGLPVESLTLDNGSEFADFKELESLLKTTVYFADPHSPWQRGSNENMNGLLRFFFPKGTDFRSFTAQAIQAVVDLINDRPRKCLNWLSPREVFFSKCCT